MPVAAYALVSLAQAREHVGVPAADTSRDAILERLVNEASRLVLRTTNREYAPKVPAAAADPDVARVVGCRVGSSIIELDPYEARSVSSVTIGGVLLDASAYTLAPIAARDGVYDRLLLHSRITGSSTGGHRVPVTVVGRWGWPEVPPDAQGWVLEMVEDRFGEDVASYADATGDIPDSGGSGGPTTIPFRIREAMEFARRTRVGSV